MTNRESVLQRFGLRLRGLRQAHGWSQEELARRTNRHWTYIGGLERGERNPTLRVLVDVATALSASIADLLGEENDTAHPLEVKFSASAWDILSAIERGFRAQVDVKGKLAEYFMNRSLQALQQDGTVDGITWEDADGKPDFIVSYKRRKLRLECKNVRSEVKFKNPLVYKVELQRTRNSKDGTPTRGYKAGDFDVLGVSLFNQTGRWDYAYVAARHLERRMTMPGFLGVMQRVPIDLREPWTDNPLQAFEDALRRTR